MPAIRVLHIGKYFAPQHGGMEVFLAELIDAQRAQGMEVAALVHGTPLPDDPPWLVRVPVQLHLVYAPVALGFRSALSKAIAKFEPHVLHLHMPNTSVFWALTLRVAHNIPWVVHWHSDVVVSTISKSLAVAYRFYRPFEQAVLDQADRVIVTSPPYLAASQALTLWHDKCSVIPLGLDPGQLPPPASKELLASLPWVEGRFRLLSIGRLTYYKGFETLIQVLADLPGVELLIVGEGDLQPSLQALISASTPAGKEPAVKLLGSVTEEVKHALLQRCDVFCLASCERTEAFGMVLLEAMAHAKPCIVTDLPGSGMPWLVAQAGAGLRVPVGDVVAWRQAIVQMQQSPILRAQYGASGYHALQDRFSIATCASSTRLAYTKAIPNIAQPHPPEDVLIVIPAKDEAATIGALIQCLLAAGWTDIIVVDDHSRDDTGQIALRSGAKVTRPVLPMGAWGAMQAGIRYAVQHGYQAVVTMDADGQHEVAELPALIEAHAKADVVIGAHPERASTARKIAWHWFRKISGFNLSDLTSGFRYYNLKSMEVLASDEATLLDYQDVGVLLLLRRAGCRIVEVPVMMNLRCVGKSRIFSSWLTVARYMALTTLLCLSRWRTAN